MCLWCFAKISIFLGHRQKMAFFCVRFWCSKRGPKERRHTMHLHSFGPLFRRRKWTHFLPGPLFSGGFLEPRFFSPRGCPTQLCSSMADNVWISTRAKSCPLPRKGSVGGVQNRRAVIAAIALDRPPPRRGAVRLRRGGMRAARGAAPKTPR